MGSLTLYPKSTCSQACGHKFSRGTAIPSRAQVNTVFCCPHANFRVFPNVTFRGDQVSQSYVIQFFASVHKLLLKLGLLVHATRSWSLSSPFSFKSPLCCWSLENSLIFFQLSASLPTSSCMSLHYVQALLSVLPSFQELLHFTLLTILWGSCSNYPHFTDDETVISFKEQVLEKHVSAKDVVNNFIEESDS